MDWLDKMNAALDYIEDNLTNRISYEAAGKKAGCSSYNFQRMFSFIADVPLAEYIRRRRMTLAALELQRDQCSVISVAQKYGYDSPISFARAFQSMQGISPKEARTSGRALILYPKLSFRITVGGAEEMRYRIEKAEPIRVAGVLREISTEDGQNFSVIPKLWEEICADGTFQTVMNLRRPEAAGIYGVCCHFRETAFDYMAAVESEKEVAQGLQELLIPACEWVKFECRGALPDALHNVWKRIYTEWFPNSGYEHTGGPEIEWYPEVLQDREQTYSEIWLPIRRCK